MPKKGTPPTPKPKQEEHPPKEKRTPRREEQSKFVNFPQICQILNMNTRSVKKLMDVQAFDWCYYGEQPRTTREELDDFLDRCIRGVVSIPNLIGKTPQVRGMAR